MSFLSRDGNDYTTRIRARGFPYNSPKEQHRNPSMSMEFRERNFTISTYNSADIQSVQFWRL